MNSFFKRATLILVFVLMIGALFTGCFNNGEGDNNLKNNYKEYALESLNKKYGKDFGVKQNESSNDSTNDNEKLICYPLDNEKDYFKVEVKKDLSKVYDGYSQILMQKKIEALLTPYAQEVFNSSVKLKPMMEFVYDDVSSQLSVEEYFNEYKVPIVLDVFIEGENNEMSAKKISDFLNGLSSKGINVQATAVFYFVKEDAFNNVEEKYYNLKNSDEFYDYFYNSEDIYTYAICTYKDGAIVEDINKINELLN